jgi:hypothetical protein
LLEGSSFGVYISGAEVRQDVIRVNGACVLPP